MGKPYGSEEVGHGIQVVLHSLGTHCPWALRGGVNGKNVAFELGGPGFENSSATPVGETIGQFFYLFELQLSGCSITNGKQVACSRVNDSVLLIAPVSHL